MTERMRQGNAAAEDGAHLSYYWRSGEQGLEPLVVVPGLGMTAQTCFGLVAAMDPNRPVAAIDPRGSGKSDPVTSSVDGETSAGDVVAVLDRLGWDRVHIAGVSMGGMISQHVAVRHRSRLLSISLVNTYARADSWATLVWQLRRALALQEDPSTQRLAAALFLTSPGAVAKEPDIVDTLFDLWAESPPDPLSYREQMQFCANHDVYDQLREIEIAALVISAADDLLCTPRAGEELADALRGRYICVGEATHLLSGARPGKVASLIEQHLQATEAQHSW